MQKGLNSMVMYMQVSGVVMCFPSQFPECSSQLSTVVASYVESSSVALVADAHVLVVLDCSRIATV